MVKLYLSSCFLTWWEVVVIVVIVTVSRDVIIVVVVVVVLVLCVVVTVFLSLDKMTHVSMYSVQNDRNVVLHIFSNYKRKKEYFITQAIHQSNLAIVIFQLGIVSTLHVTIHNQDMTGQV